MIDREDRPYFSNSIDDLETVAELHWTDGNGIILLILELFHRKTQRALALRTRLLERLSILITQKGFAWPSTEAEPTDSDSSVLIDAPATGLLRYLGYRVGKAGLNSDERHNLLDAVYMHQLPQLNSQEYMIEWAEPCTSSRLQKMANSIASFARNEKRKNKTSDEAISNWEYDLKYLYTKYYVGHFDFFWPNTSLN